MVQNKKTAARISLFPRKHKIQDFYHTIYVISIYVFIVTQTDTL